MGRIKRLTLVNTLPGFKSANLIGTISKEGQTNLAIFSSVIHLGSDPALIGFITRPVTVDRHTYRNILETEVYTINHVPVTAVRNAHQTSAGYPNGVSEFDTCHFKPFYHEGMDAPYVVESPVNLGVRYRERYDIKANGTILIVGEVEQVLLPPDALQSDGSVDLTQCGTAIVSGLDTYLKGQQIARFSYARTHQQPTEIGE